MLVELLAALLLVPVPVTPIDELVGRSDVVVVGSIVSVGDAGPASITTPSGTTVSGRAMAGRMVVDQVLKGPRELRELRFDFVQTDDVIGYRGVRADSYRIVFLRRSGADYEFTSPYKPSVVAVPGASVSATKPEDAVFQVLGTVLRDAKSSANDKREAIYAMWPGRVPNAEAIKALRPMLEDSDPSLQCEAAASLLQSNDVTALPYAEHWLLGERAHPWPTCFGNLRGGIAFGIKDPVAIPSLTRLLRAREVETRRVVAGALRHTQSSDAIPALGSALDDLDLDVEYSAVAGLSEITGQTAGMPGIPLFKSNPGAYVSLWKDRLAKRQD
jgi:hypothetical protein